jgi:hypothetical protein
MKKMKNIIRSGKLEAGSSKPEAESRAGLFPEKENKEYRITNVESGSQETEVGSRKIEAGSGKREARSFSGIPVSYSLFPYFEIKEYPINLPGLLTGNVESGRKISGHVILIPEGLHVYREMDNLENSTPNGVVHFNSSWYFYKHLMPLASGKPGTTATMTTTTTTTSKYKDAPLLPRGRFYSGDCPGAAAITIILSLFSSPRVSPNFAGTNRLAQQCNLPVINQQALHRSSFVPLFKGDEIRFSESGGKWDESRFIGTGGIDDKTPNPRVQEVSTTSPKIRMKGFLKERRYAYVLN